MTEIKCNKLNINSAYEIEFEPYCDHRGIFTKIFGEKALSECLEDDFEVKQVNLSYNRARGTLRGLHLQVAPFEDSKIVYCLNGEVLDIILDLRKHSPTFGQYHCIRLSSDKKNAVFIPKGVAHGFQTIKEDSRLLYLHSDVYKPENNLGVNALDPTLDLPWPLPVSEYSDKDRMLPMLVDYAGGSNGL